MLSVASLLNPAAPGSPAQSPRYRPGAAALSSSFVSFPPQYPNLMYERHFMSSKHRKVIRDSGGFVKSKTKGQVNFPPFEALDEPSLREIKQYQIYPFGEIQEYCRHIPYNSGKKDFYDKTGRDGFEVLQYIFKVPGDENDYTVMWDYNVGLVRMTPFFKCCKYSKTQPAKMLNMNPGLRNITHSITGGSIMAQGYWMPFSCAKAVCATFCAPIAGALIPIFGPDFPSQCVSPDGPDFGRMVIDPSVIEESAREADLFRRMYANAVSVASNNHLPQHLHRQQMHNHYSLAPALPSPTSIPSPRLTRRALPQFPSPHEYDRERECLGSDVWMRTKRGPDSSYGTDAESELQAGPVTPAPHHISNRGMPCLPLSPPGSSGTSNDWPVAYPHSHPSYPSHAHLGTQHPTSAFHSGACGSNLNQPHDYPCAADRGPNPILSAVPSFGHSQRLEHQHQQQQGPRFSHRPHPFSKSDFSQRNMPPMNVNIKRRGADFEAEHNEYDRDSHKSSPTMTVMTDRSVSRGSACRQNVAQEPTTSGVDKNAAFLLMNLSVREHKYTHQGTVDGRKENRRVQDGFAVANEWLSRGCGPETMSMSPLSGTAGGHRSKRRRATSM
ncbi:hypothetical protein M406DRAFT_327890 [Cryphonectria parasitica EP155]|uniref:HTH APSES-type domain-containing protein n=1 Tax=Cryphonectria parasitica (strain ATCC 38755 / EP155) TaxID=660469 RepID=A0A9P4Y634_CRYP1|nr:uncharacterized protein M406DRAFT_327890 [Cryphonectria parasitica EP155]KAF3766770.1 hypothetical protein M406DRAFT_327890 [Cryphonectria parasitica EP155]